MSMSAGKEGRSKVKDEVDSDSDGDENVPLSVSVPKKEHNKEVKRDDEETGISNSKRTVRKAKVEYSSSEEDYGRVLSKRTVLIKDTKATVVKKRGHAGAVREKKTYILPGQKHDPPEERDPLRIFYESLYQQVPTSDMAAIWMMEWGLLQEDEAVAVLEKKKNLQTKLKSPFKINTVKKTNSGSAKALKKETTLKANSTAKKITTTKKRKLFNFSSEDENDFVEPTKNLKSSTAKKNTTTKKHKLFDVSSEDENDFVEPTKNLKSSTAKKITTTKKHKIFDGSSEDENNFVEPGKNLKSSTAKKITTTKKHKLFEGSSEGEIDFVAPTKKLKR